VASEASGLSGVAERYATALYELADEGKSIDAVAAELRRLKQLIEDNADLRRLLRSPLIDRKVQTRAMLEVLGAMRVNELVRRFVGVVGQHRRLFALPEMIEAFLRQLARRRGEITAHVTTARPLAPAQSEALAQALRAAVGRKINIETKVDADLIGGLVVRVGSRMVDTSLRTQLQKLRRSLRAA
jgi:F-type H+-transporting ATPase subunit delta